MLNLNCIPETSSNVLKEFRKVRTSVRFCCYLGRPLIFCSGDNKNRAEVLVFPYLNNKE